MKISKQRKEILRSVDTAKNLMPKNFNPKTALIIDENFKLPADIVVKAKVKLSGLTEIDAQLTDRYMYFADAGGKDIIVMQRYYFYEGVSMRTLGHFIYVLKYLGVKNIISIDESAALNPRFEEGSLALVYDQINLMGDNPLIGENDEELGIRFPDMSNAYDKDLFGKMTAVFQKAYLKLNESVCLAIIGPESETEAEARFYREIGADLVNYGFAPEVITAVHCGVKYSAIGMITRMIIADRMMNDMRTDDVKTAEQKIAYDKAYLTLISILQNILKIQ